ncbi:MAG: DUF885 family protein [Acidobacteria bacterium]|nr:DUF885 family protein [Acidobacteriota bacterium]MCA1609659.1 DUF885 family protein [Acidobacteriota bacterium]
MPARTFRILLSAAFFAILSLSAAIASPADDLAARRKAFSDLLAEHWEYTLSHSPEFASILGDKRWNDKASDLSEREILADQQKDREWLARLAAIDTTGFPEQEALTKTLLVRRLKESIDNERFQNWKMSVSQFFGIHLQAPQMVSLLPFTTVKDYDDYIARLKQLPKQFDDTTARMRKGMAEGLMQPRFLLEKVVTQSGGIAAQKPEDTPFARPLSKIPPTFSPEDAARIKGEVLTTIRESVLPAYARFTEFVKAEYAPKGRTEPGMWSLPDGEARYAAQVKRLTTTDKTPEEIHRIGLAQVAEIEKQMLVIAKKLGFSDLKAFNASIEKDPKRHYRDREEILTAYRRAIDQMRPQLPKLFGRLPKAEVEVAAVESFREKEASGAQYNTGAKDGSRPGRVMVNTSQAESRKTISTESTAYHEGVPGHHLQLSIAQEQDDLPPVRQQAGYTAFVEGWALYSERLGKDVGFYRDPYSDYGRLQDEMLRAIRLVVDTGFHYKKWSRDQVVAFFHDHSAVDEVEVQSETDRYIAWPGQALAYKIGQLKILELRDRARKELGAAFDIRAFHDEILGAGALPLDILDQRIDGWILERKGRRKG